MMIFLLIALSLLNWLLDLPINEAKFALFFQNICKNMSPHSSEYSNLYSATICGINPPPSAMIWDFRNSGLYHLIVVSGAHLIFCSVLLDKILFFRPCVFKTSLKFIFLLSYSLFSGMNPPVVRAFVGLILASSAERYKLNWSGSMAVLFSGFVCLAIFPSWWSSLSFLMSWSAAFALTTTSSALKKSAMVYLIMLVPMCGLGLNSPATIFLNWLMAPILGFVLLPVSFLPFLHSGFLVFSDWVWRILIYIISLLSQLSFTATVTYQIPVEVMWIFLLGLQYGLYHLTVQRRKKELV